MKLTNEKLRDIIREELDRFNGKSVNEGFSTWEIEFGKGKVSGVDYAKAGKVSVDARTSSEAIKKAVKIVQAKAGFKGSDNDWMAVDIETLIKK